MNKKLILVNSLALCGSLSFLSGCVGSSSNNTATTPTNATVTPSPTPSPTSTVANLYNVPEYDSAGNLYMQKIKFKQLSSDALNTAYALSAAKSQQLLSTTANTLINSYSKPTNSADTNLDDFYDSTKQPVLNQQAFGSCVTFSSTAALGYLLYNNTGALSPIKFLMQAFVSIGNQAGDGSGDYSGNFASGWDGLNGADNILHRVLDIPGDLYNAPGIVQESWGTVPANNFGYFLSSQADTDAYNQIATEYQNAGYPNLTTSVLTGLAGFNQALTDYNNNAQNAIKTNGDAISNKDINFVPGSDGDTSASVAIKQALDNGHKVLMGFNVYDAAIPASATCANSSNASPTGDTYYSYDQSTQTLVHNASSTQTDTWSSPTGCVIGGHEVFVVGYFQDSTTGKLIFVIRNSWGANAGDRGNYYMTQDYANVAVMSINEINKK